jgi:hypothetical protein
MGHLVMLGLIIVDPLDALGRETVNGRIWVGHQDWRMRRDDELGIVLNQVVNACQDGELALRRERGFGFIE